MYSVTNIGMAGGGTQAVESAVERHGKDSRLLLLVLLVLAVVCSSGLLQYVGLRGAFFWLSV